MKVILLKDVPKIGRRFEVKEVSDGHAANFLIPRGLAERATPAALAELDRKMKETEAQRAVESDLIKKNFETLKAAPVTVKRPANEEGHLFAGIKAGDIVAAIAAQTGISLGEEMILLEHPIKTTGEHLISLESGAHKTTLKFVVEPE